MIIRNHSPFLGLTSRKLVCSVSLFCLLPLSSALAEVETLESLSVTADALKVETPMQEAPVSVSVVNREELDIRQVQKIDEALRYKAGVLSAPYGSDNDTDWLRVRGFEAATYLDGSRLFKAGYYGWLLEPFGIESIEVLKGPASILYGEAPPGGVINVVSKKPSNEPQGLLDIQLGNRNHKQIGLDVSGSASVDGHIRYRVATMFSDSDGVLEGTNNQRFFIAPSLAIDISDRTQLTLLANIKRDEGVPTNGFFPAYGSLINTEFGQLATDTNLGEPEYDINENTQISVGYELSHAFNDTWKLKQNTRFGYTDLLLRSAYAFPSADSAVVGRGLVYRDGDIKSLGVDTQAIGNWKKGSLEHTLLAGFEMQTHQNDSSELDSYGFGDAINIFTFESGNYTPIDTSTATKREIIKTLAGLYFQHQLKTDAGLVMIAGARYDNIDLKNKNLTADTNDSGDESQVSFNAGILYQSDSGFSPYLSYAESFEVLNSIDPATDKLYKPLEGQQTEVGVKYIPEVIDGYINFALFDLEQTNSLVSNPETYVQTQIGEVTSQGVELEAVGYLTEALKLTASYTYTDAETNNTAGKGKKRVGLIPKHIASVWMDYEFNANELKGLRLGGGVRYVGSSVDNPASSDRKVPDVTLLDFSVDYDFAQNWQAQFSINNIADEEYVTSCDYYCYYGEGRTAIASIKYRW